MRIVVLGAAGQLGREVVRILSARGHAVCAAVRRPPVPAFDREVEIQLVDARNKTELRAAISGFDAVVNVIGGGTLRKNDVASTTSRIAVAAAEESAYTAISRCQQEWSRSTGRCSSMFCAHSFSATFWLNIAVWKKS